MKLHAAIWFAALLPAAHAQFQISAVVNGVEHSVGATYDLGAIAPATPLQAQFRLRNVSNNPATLTLLGVAGTGFALSSAPVTPLLIPVQGTAAFAVTFQSPDAGSYSAAVKADGVSLLLTATVVPALTYELQASPAPLPLGAVTDFGSVEVGQSAILQFLIDNHTTQSLTIPTITLTGSDFGFSVAPPATAALTPGARIEFALQFSPSAPGARQGALVAGAAVFALSGTGLPIPLPKPQISIDLANPASGQQGKVTVAFDVAARTSGSGTVMLGFQPSVAGASDPAIAFASGGQSAQFTVAPGDTQGRFAGQPTLAFQTGTTAGSLIVTALLGGITSQSSIAIAPAQVSLSPPQGTRSASGIEVDLTGFDNTRTAGSLSFSFFDGAGTPIAPGAIQADASAAFSQFFQGSNLGGSFVLRALFPVTGDASRIASFQAAITNSAGTATTARTVF